MTKHGDQIIDHKDTFGYTDPMRVGIDLILRGGRHVGRELIRGSAPKTGYVSEMAAENGSGQESSSTGS